MIRANMALKISYPGLTHTNRPPQKPGRFSKPTRVWMFDLCAVCFLYSLEWIVSGYRLIGLHETWAQCQCCNRFGRNDETRADHF